MLREKLYVVKQLLCKIGSKKYSENTYAVIYIYSDVNNQKLNTFEVYVRDIELADAKIDDNSSIKILQKFIKSETIVSEDMWSKMKNGVVSLDDIDLTNKGEK